MRRKCWWSRAPPTWPRAGGPRPGWRRSLSLRLAVDYANQRKVFGNTPISAYQGLQFPLAQCHAEIESARLMNYKAAANFDAGLPYGSEANVAKLLAAAGGS